MKENKILCEKVACKSASGVNGNAGIHCVTEDCKASAIVTFIVIELGP